MKLLNRLQCYFISLLIRFSFIGTPDPEAEDISTEPVNPPRLWTEDEMKIALYWSLYGSNHMSLDASVIADTINRSVDAFEIKSYRMGKLYDGLSHSNDSTKMGKLLRSFALLSEFHAAVTVLQSLITISKDRGTMYEEYWSFIKLETQNMTTIGRS